MPPKKQLPKHPRAYRNMEFLGSPDGRIIRIMAEFLEPQRRFRKHNIRDTIVFFGSARIKPRGESTTNLRAARLKIKNVKRPTTVMMTSLHQAEMQLEMSRYYEDTVEVARLLTRWSKTLKQRNRFVVCSGGGPGIMEAANRGAYLAKGKSIGLNISLPFEQFANAYITPELNFEFHYFFLRKFWFAYLAKALVVFPGGFGTLDELLEVLTLVQTQKIKKKMTVVIYGSEYWTKVLNFDEMVSRGVLSKEDLKLFKFIDTPKEAFLYLKKSLMKNYPTA
ncbi:MAG: LOG family protein [Bacteroidota bacterium]